METIGLIISILVGLTTLLAIVIWCGKFIQRVNEHDKKLDVQSSKLDEQSYNINKQAVLITEQGKNIDKQGVKIDEQSKNIDKLVRLVESHDHRILSLSEDMAEVKRDLYGLKNDVSDLRVTVASINGFLSSGAGGGTIGYRKNSPRKLDELGESIFKEMNGAAFLNKNKNELFAYIDRLGLKTAFDVENVALMACVSKSSTDMFIGIKSYIYNCSEKEVDGKFYEVTLQLVCRILSIPLRDLYLEEHPEIIR